MKVWVMKLEIAASVGQGEAITEEHRTKAALLLRTAAERIEQGQDLGGFHFGPDDHNDGGFAVYAEKVDVR